MSIMSSEPTTLVEFFQDFIRRHSKTAQESGWLVLDVTPDEREAIGRCFIYIMAGWAAEFEMKRSRGRGILLPDWMEPTVSATSSEAATLVEYFQDFVRKHSKTGPESGWLVLDVTPEECRELGTCFFYIMAGWAAEFEMKRSNERGILLPDWIQPVVIVDEDERLFNGKIN